MYPFRSVTHVAQQREPATVTPQLLFTLSCGHRIRKPAKGRQIDALKTGKLFKCARRMKCRHC